MPVFYLNRRSACRREAAMERLKDSAESFNLMNVESLAPKLDVREFDEATGVDAEREAARLLRRGMKMLEAEDAPRKELLRSIERLAHLPCATKHFHSVEMEALHSMAARDVRCDRVDFEFITRYSSACSTAGYINAALYAAIVDRLSQRAKVKEQRGSGHQPISHRNIITLLAIITTKQRSTAKSSPHREETRLFAALIACLYRSPSRRLAAADAAVVCQAVGEAHDRRLIDIREWMGSDSYSLVTEVILPRMMSLPLPCFTVADIVLILSGCALQPGVSQLSVKFLDRCLPRLLAESSTLEATQISLLLSSVMHIYRDQWVAVAGGVARLDDGDDFQQYRHMPHNFASKLVQSLKARKHEPSELARIALGVARLCT
ncbi:hypothetical protein FOZ63_005545 [Perkinsus olseni]|uniref:Uncharacterized protein n=1 Tax=Perkinsus olseni TaxID=32597 RepID=A0A7J6RXW3_PEROL|nr:hypothetical protein FOZ63_005545 [Perkinsus olseni]